jgi:hypothetical protein
LKNLHSLGYINYEPSHNPFKGSHVYLFNFSEELKPMLKKDRNLSSNSEPVFGLVAERVLNQSYTSSETGTEQAVVSYINNTNIPNIPNNLNVSNLDEQAKKNENDDGFLKNEATQKKEKSSAKKEKEEMLETLDDANRQMLQTFANSDENQIKNSWQKSSAKKEENEMPKELLLENTKIAAPAFADTDEKQTEKSRQKVIVPKIENVKSYFLEQNFPELEANKFFNYFSSVGWLVGGKTPMVDWQAAAQNWILNAPKFKHNTDTTPIDRSKHLNVANDKDYAEPL